ncbi:MAG: ZIP family zinc transporter [Chloroflexia bacterium]
MLEATFWGLVGGFALIVGAVAGLTLHWPRFAIGLVSSFGSGVLLSVAAFELTQKAYETGGADVVALGVAGGALTFFVGDWLVERAGARKRKRSGAESHEGSNSTALVLGALLDGVPESAAIGITLLGGGGVGVSVVVAVFLSNIPESLASAAGMRAAGRSTVYITVWSLVACASGLAAGGVLTSRGRLGKHRRSDPDVCRRRDTLDAR